MPQRDAVDDHASPIVPAEDDAGAAELARELGNVVGDALAAVELDVFGDAGGGAGVDGGGVGAAEAHEVRGDDAVAEREEEGNLVAPAEGEVGPAVDEEDGVGEALGGDTEEVVVAFLVQGGIFVGDAGVAVGGDGVGHVGWFDVVR